jgi:hypothetical protein
MMKLYEFIPGFWIRPDKIDWIDFHEGSGERKGTWILEISISKMSIGTGYKPEAEARGIFDRLLKMLGELP